MNQEIIEKTLSTSNEFIPPGAFYSTVNGKKYRYLSSKPWEESPLMTYHSLQDASFPIASAERLNDYRSTFDLIVRHPGMPVILLTQEHNRLLYECEMGLLPPGQRTLINLDSHDDFSMREDSAINIGNWGSFGTNLGYWNRFVHLYPKLDGWHNYQELREGVILLTRGNEETEHSFSQLSSYQWNYIDICKIVNGKYILSIDTDSVALYEERLNPYVLEPLSVLLRHVKLDPMLELVHVSLSPTHCRGKNGIAIWNYLRDVLLEEEK
jgi:hypothetical protein